MPRWAQVFVLLTGMAAWLAMVAVSLLMKEIPSAVLIGFPAGLWIALNRGNTIARRRAAARRVSRAPESAADEEGDPA